MSLNWKEINLVLDELRLDDSFLQEIRQFDYHHLLLQFYGRKSETVLLVSLKPGALRIHRTEKRYKALPKPPRFTTFLKARVKGGKAYRVEQIGSERIIEMSLNRSGEEFFLYIKLWENNANLIITDGNHVILDCFSRRPNRNEVPGKKYDPRKEWKDEPPRREFEVRPLPGEGDFNRRIEAFYASKESDQDLTRLRELAARGLKTEKKRLENRLEKLEDQISDYDNPLRFKEWGDLIMSRLYDMKRGDKFLEAAAFDEKGEEIPLSLELDPTLSPVENGERYYKRFKKAQTGLKLAREEKDQVALRLAKLEEDLENLPEERDENRLRSYINLDKQQKRTGDSSQPGLRFSSGPFLILVGRNSRENDELLRRHVRGNDIWMHNRDWPGGYVFIKTIKGKSVPLDTLLDAGNLALHYSRGSKSDRADLYYTEVKYLRRAKGAAKGTVLPTQEKNLRVKRDEKRLARLLNRDG